jgi:hypothetical protein
LPKNQARKLYTFAKEQLDALKNPVATPIAAAPVIETPVAETTPGIVEEPEVEEVLDFAEIIPVAQSGYRDEKQFPEAAAEQSLAELSQDALFEKLQNYKKLLDNGLILQGEYDRLKAEILKYL